MSFKDFLTIIIGVIVTAMVLMSFIMSLSFIYGFEPPFKATPLLAYLYILVGFTALTALILVNVFGRSKK